MVPPDHWLGVKEVAQRFGVSRQTAHRWIVAFMPHLRLGRVVRVSEQAVEDFARRFTENPSWLSSNGSQAAGSGTPSCGCRTGNASGAARAAPTGGRRTSVPVSSSENWPRPVMPRTKPARSGTP
ncbi:MAG: helix-turn-helix domain-containing protein [Deltaproteobacteria bacterium]|nr:helix-turn-helix domain-containing protein [Deltaproteobacteria bacterium]